MEGKKSLSFRATSWSAYNTKIFTHLTIFSFCHLSLPIQLLYSPQTKEKISFSERLIDYYCRTASIVHDESIKNFSLHAHLHLSYQVLLHGGLAHVSIRI